MEVKRQARPVEKDKLATSKVFQLLTAIKLPKSALQQAVLLLQ